MPAECGPSATAPRSASSSNALFNGIDQCRTFSAPRQHHKFGLSSNPAYPNRIERQAPPAGRNLDDRSMGASGGSGDQWRHILGMKWLRAGQIYRERPTPHLEAHDCTILNQMSGRNSLS